MSCRFFCVRRVRTLPLRVMDGKNEHKSGMSQSFVTGAIAAVFLIVGYQTAVFVHRAALMKIEADRDEPDTVFVYVPMHDSGTAARTGTAPVQVSRKRSSHSPRVETVRKNLPYRKVESFEFDPNTVSVEDLCRLGFSVRQAQSIENYRVKGGRFRRKSDFSSSFVVSDSIYRRLEPFIRIPLTDLNEADSAAFDALPGIGGWFAKRIIEHRTALGGYSCKEQLLDIKRFDKDKYDALSDLVTVSEPYRYPLWELSADSLWKHPYIRNREVAVAIVLFREHHGRDNWTVDNLVTAGVISSDTASRLRRCVE